MSSPWFGYIDGVNHLGNMDIAIDDNHVAMVKWQSLCGLEDCALPDAARARVGLEFCPICRAWWNNAKVLIKVAEDLIVNVANSTP